LAIIDNNTNFEDAEVDEHPTLSAEILERYEIIGGRLHKKVDAQANS
jgi:hypothetical protein